MGACYRAKKPRNRTQWRALGAKPLAGFQLRYIYFINPNARQRLTVPILPFSKIDEMGASMYKGEKITRGKQAMTGDQPEQRQCDTDPPAPLNAENQPFAEVTNDDETTETHN